MILPRLCFSLKGLCFGAIIGIAYAAYCATDDNTTGLHIAAAAGSRYRRAYFTADTAFNVGLVLVVEASDRFFVQ